MVATREGGVDRNADMSITNSWESPSPPARVAWIETDQILGMGIGIVVSPPARVAWIETSTA